MCNKINDENRTLILEDKMMPQDMVGYLDENSTEEEIQAQMEADDKLMTEDCNDDEE